MYPTSVTAALPGARPPGRNPLQQEPLDLSLPSRTNARETPGAHPPGGVLAQVAELTGPGTPQAFAPPAQDAAPALPGPRRVGRPRSAVASSEAVFRRVPDAEKEVRFRVRKAQTAARHEAAVQAVAEAGAPSARAVEQPVTHDPDRTDADPPPRPKTSARARLERLAAAHGMDVPEYCRYRHRVTAANSTDETGRKRYINPIDNSLDMHLYWSDEWRASKARKQRKAQQAAQAARLARAREAVRRAVQLRTDASPRPDRRP